MWIGEEVGGGREGGKRTSEGGSRRQEYRCLEAPEQAAYRVHTPASTCLTSCNSNDDKKRGKERRGADFFIYLFFLLCFLLPLS